MDTYVNIVRGFERLCGSVRALLRLEKVCRMDARSTDTAPSSAIIRHPVVV